MDENTPWNLRLHINARVYSFNALDYLFKDGTYGWMKFELIKDFSCTMYSCIMLSNNAFLSVVNGERYSTKSRNRIFGNLEHQFCWISEVFEYNDFFVSYSRIIFEKLTPFLTISRILVYLKWSNNLSVWHIFL